MFTAPPLPPHARRPGRLVRALTGIGLGTAAMFLLVVNLVLFLFSAYFVATPEGLYHRTWEQTARHIYDPADLKNWAQWEHKYDGRLATAEDAHKAIGEMLDSIGDRYTYFMDFDAVMAERERSQGNFTGVGMVLGVQTGPDGQPVKAADGNPLPETDAAGYPLVKQLINGGPAKAAGLKPGDAITTVDGTDTRGKSLKELIASIRGEVGTSVTFGVRRDGQDSTLTITRQTVNVPAVTTKMLTNGIGYLRLEGFDQFDATDEVIRGLNELKDAKALVIDLRGNPGGFVHNAIDISSLFLEQGTVVTIRSRIPGDPTNPKYETQVIKLTPSGLVSETTTTDDPDADVDTDSRKPYMAANRPVVVLVNGNSASASEMFTGALQDNGAATVIGTRTFGKGIGQSSVLLPNLNMLHVTSLRYFTPNGTWLGDGGNTGATHGIEPDIVVEPARNLEFGEESDNQLDNAIEFLNQKLGSKSSRLLFRTAADRAA